MPGLLLPVKAAHSQAPTSTSTVTSQIVAMDGKPSITPSNTATRTIAVKTRCLSTTRGLAGPVVQLLAREAITPLARGKRFQRRLQVRNLEIRPQDVADVNFGVREIPQQEIADAVIAAGADEQVRIGNIREFQFGREAFFVDVIHTQRSAGDRGREFACCLHDVPA